MRKIYRIGILLYVVMLCLLGIFGCGKKTKAGYNITDKNLPSAECVKIGNLEGLKFNKVQVQIDDEDALSYLQSTDDSIWYTNDDMTAEEQDTVKITFLGYHDGELFDGGSAEGYELVLGNGNMIPGFEEGIIGMKPGETKSITVTFPNDYSVFPGEATTFEITLDAIKIVVDFTQEQIEEAKIEMEKLAEVNSNFELREDVWDEIMKNSDVMYVRQSDLARYEQEYEEGAINIYGTLGNYFATVGITEETYLEDKENNATAYAIYDMLTDVLCDRFQITDETVENSKTAYADSLGVTYETLQESYDAETIKKNIKRYLIAETVLEKAEINILK